MTETRLEIRVTPKASRNRIVVEGEAVRVYVTAPPADGEANAAVVETLAKALRVGKSSLAVVAGSTSRHKTILIEGLAPDDVWIRLRTP